MSNVPLAELVEESIRSFRAGYKRDIKLVVEQKSIVRADQQKLKQLFYILMDNAHKYSDASIRVNVRTVQNKALIEIIDQGVGIPASDLAMSLIVSSGWIQQERENREDLDWVFPLPRKLRI